MKAKMRLSQVWDYLNSLKIITVQHLPEEQWKEVKLACDQMFQVASDGKYNICPAWYIGAL
jgi:uncharacterized protein YaiL (DUF2058 family)